MRAAPVPARIPGVDETTGSDQLCVQIVVGSDPVRGTAQLPNGEQSEFWGWLELAEIVQSATKAETGGSGVEGASTR